MKKLFIMMLLGVTPIIVSAQAGHIMQGIGAVTTDLFMIGLNYSF